MTTTEAGPSPNPWRRFLALGPLRVTTWFVALLAWFYLFARTDWNLFEISVWSVPFLLMLAVVSLPWRTVRWRTIVAFFMTGMGPVFLFVLFIAFVLDVTGVEDLIGRLLRSLASAGNDLRITNVSAHLIAPVVEETAKVLPLVLVLWWRQSFLRTSAGPLDLAVLAGATGAGMGFAEDIFVYLHQGLPGPTSGIFGLGLGPVYANLFGVERPGFVFGGRSWFADTAAFFFPEMQETLGVVWMGHGALTLGIGLSLGLAIWWSRQYGSRWFYLIPVMVFLAATMAHLLTNWYGGSGCQTRPSPLCIVASIGLHGRVLTLLVLAGWAYAAWISGRHLRKHREMDPALTLPGNSINRASYSSRGWRGWLALYSDRFDFFRWRRKTGYGAFHVSHARRLTRGQLLSVMASRVETLHFKERLEGSPETAISDEARAIMDQVAPLP